MTELLLAIATHPLQDIEVMLTLLAAMAFITFLRGFLTGLQHLLLINMDADHLEHTRARAMWAMMLLWVFFGAWEAVRWIAAALAGVPIEHTSAITAVIIFDLVAFFLLPAWLMPKGGGH